MQQEMKDNTDNKCETSKNVVNQTASSDSVVSLKVEMD